MRPLHDASTSPLAVTFMSGQCKAISGMGCASKVLADYLRGIYDAVPGRYTATSAHENWSLMHEGLVVDLLNDEIRHVGARDEPAHPVPRIDQCAIGVRL